jgi:hypothetical protein
MFIDDDGVRAWLVRCCWPSATPANPAIFSNREAKMNRYSFSLFALLLLAVSFPFATSAARPAGPPVAVGSYANIPLHFEPNRGQAPAEAMFISRGRGYSLYLTATGPVLGLAAGGSAAATTNLTIAFGGGNPLPEIVGLEPIGGRVNYFRGSDPSEWIVNVPTFAQVAYRDVYPGVDILWYGNQRELEFDVVIAPGADPRSVRLDVSGVRSVEIDSRGEVVLVSDAGRTALRKPFVYQQAEGERQ